MYGIIATDEAPNFGPIGMGGGESEVITVGTQGLAAVISDASLDHYTLSKENLTTHTRVIEKVAEDYTILPMRFCTVAESTDEILSFLEDNERQLKNSLKDLEGKVEIGIKIIWKNMKEIYEEMTLENRKIKEIKTGGGKDMQGLIQAGQMVEVALEEKKAVEGEEYLRPLKKMSVRFKEEENKTEDMVVTASFLIDKAWLGEFDAQVDKMGREHHKRIDVKYIGPIPPFSFVNLEMHWE
ncbi:MAG: GvpL/GvpF family gas vesicle protein [Deltaproteobacteria bacterium]|nr:GvpL/GvpF family gas vesicle protein [Deltaproteobacteria bacterium]